MASFHKNYFEFSADCHFDLGVQEGRAFKKTIQQFLKYERRDPDWERKVRRSFPYLNETRKNLPHCIEELRGQAEGADVSMEELFALAIEDELEDASETAGKCTSILTGGGEYFGHNEDWTPEAKESICVVKRRIKDLTILELFYVSTLGGNSVSINSHGIIQSINSLSHKDYQVGVPKTMISRHMIESSNPVATVENLKKIKRSSGFHHLFYSLKEKKGWSWECSAKKETFKEVTFPFIHTNHYLSSLSTLEENSNIDFSQSRFKLASQHFPDFGRSPASGNGSPTITTMEQLQSVLLDKSFGNQKSILNRRTIAQVLIDLSRPKMKIKLMREKEKGWVSYPLDFLLI